MKIVFINHAQNANVHIEVGATNSTWGKEDGAEEGFTEEVGFELVLKMCY